MKIRFAIVNKDTSTFSLDEVREILIDLSRETNASEDIGIYERSDSCIRGRISYRDGFYFVDVQIATYDHSCNLDVVIMSQKAVENSYDNKLEDLKCLLKDKLLKAWANSKCIWIEDEQSLELCHSLYLGINRAENALRTFINLVMTTLKGVEWWEKFVPQKIKMKHKGRNVQFKRTAESFKNVDDHLISIDVDDLVDVMRMQVKKWEPQHDENIETWLVDGNEKRLFDKLKSQLAVKFDFWDSIFGKYFDVQFLDAWATFCKNRNHIAHNKPIDKSAYNLMEENIGEILQQIATAEAKFRENVWSREMIDEVFQIIAGEELQEDIVAHEKFRAELESGVSVFSLKDIERTFMEFIDSFVERLEDILYFVRHLSISAQDYGKLGENVCVAKIESVFSDEPILIYVSALIVDGSGSESDLIIIVTHKQEKIAEHTINFYNGEITYNPDQGTYEPGSAETLETNHLSEFLEELEEEIRQRLPNLTEKVNWQPDEGVDPYANLPCNECGEFTVNVDQRVGEIGRCATCGEHHELTNCMRCDGYIEGKDGFCDNCISYIERQ